MTASGAGLHHLILDQPIFHCSSIAKSLLYSWELSCRYCVCTHSLERNPILRSNPQAEQSKRALLLYSAKPNWGGWGASTALPTPSAGSTRGENTLCVHKVYKLVKIHTHRHVTHNVRFQGQTWRKGCCETLEEFWLVGICCVLSRKLSGPHWMRVRVMHKKHTYLFQDIWQTDWLVLHASFIILTVCRRHILGVQGNSPHQHSAAISCTTRDMPHLNGNLNCSREHYLQKVPC